MKNQSKTIRFGDTHRHFPVPKTFSVIAKPIGPKCNLNCTYCYYLEKENFYPDTTKFKLRENALEQFIKSYIQDQEAGHITFAWQGGEPTMLGVDYFKKALELQKKYANGKTIANAFQTNGTYITDEWCSFFKDNGFLVGISIDGPEKLNDHYRRTKGGEPTFRKIMKGIELLHKHQVEFNTLSVVNDLTSQYPLEIYRFLKSIGSTFMQFIPIVECSATQDDNLKLVTEAYEKKAHVTEWSVDPEKYGEFLCAIFDEWVRNDVARYFVQIFDVTLANWIGQSPGLCVFGDTCGRAAAIEHNGDVYSCDHYVYENYYLGNVMDTSLGEMLASQKQTDFGLAKRNSLPRYCLQCEYHFACHGECPKNRFIKTPDGQDGLNYLCKGYKMFFKYATPFMNYMAKELEKKRAPANVMQWIKQKESKKIAYNKLGRNDPCFCGSGLKYKKCHGK
ncbi:anaerobic sulfatase-maturation protein [Desulforhopalus singaporensis]|uniref:Radical SAM core domain-containing protein n=1 Tax=Desulforhopalus singaporensis TaxID=91360 RepID=A0A1H0VMW2_9BACT|nr:anaerobic sulfatase-maturation protein [Desulforhopalus singaporensis]SDP79555.1 uncharacterized protein SAMN05660330_04143 [Desulforhopalus singaporensis]